MADMLTAPSSSSTSFSCFPNLPPEIRIQIWHFSLPPPRLIELYTARGEVIFRNSSSSITRRRRPFKHIYINKVAPPILMQICHESRSVGLKHYKLTFDMNPRPSKDTLLALVPSGRGDSVADFPFDTPAQAYVDLDRDIVLLAHSTRCRGNYQPYPSMPVGVSGLFDHDVFTSALSTDVLQRIRYFAIMMRGSLRLEDVRSHAKRSGVFEVLFLLGKQRNTEGIVWEHRLRRIAKGLGPELRDHIKVFPSEKKLRLALEEGKLSASGFWIKKRLPIL